jgi:hypothetical protein
VSTASKPAWRITTRILFSFEVSRGFEADGLDEGIEIVDDALIEAIELGSIAPKRLLRRFSLHRLAHRSPVISTAVISTAS